MSEAELPPISCTLTPNALGDRRGRWQRLIKAALISHRQTPDGLRLAFVPGPETHVELEDLASLERDCCAFADWSVVEEPAGLILEVRAIGDGATAVRALFDELPASATSG